MDPQTPPVTVNNPSTAAPAAAAPSPGPTVPDAWPGGFGLYKFSKTAVKYNLGTILPLLILIAVIDTVVNFVFRAPVGRVIVDLAQILITAALSISYISSVRQTKISLSEAFQKAGQLFLMYFVLSIVIGLALIASFVLLVIPFFFVLPRLVLAPYFLIDKHPDNPIDAIKASWEASKGHGAKIWGIVAVNVLFFLLMVTIIGIPFALYFIVMYSAAFAVLYEMIKDHTPVPAASPAVAPAMPAAAAVPPVVAPVVSPETPTNPAPPAAS